MGVVDGSDMAGVGGGDVADFVRLAAVTWQISYGFPWPASLNEGRGH